MPDERGIESYEPVIGLEVHAQLRTRTKIFCGCPTDFGAPPNSQVCPVCLGHPGALPVPNATAVELAVRAALALGCTVRENSIFARKSYFYPDLPKGYQISQFEAPLATGGEVELEARGGVLRVRLRRLHVEEDAGKLVHEGVEKAGGHTYVDFNRAGVPLLEIVTEPDLRDAHEAYLCLQRLRSVLRYTEVCDGNMEQGSLRCDANISVRPRGQAALGPRTELKNLNSFRNVQRALAYEAKRQIDLLRAGDDLAQQTLLWDAGAGTTRALRDKEESPDYRYFPEPDLPPLRVTPAWVERIRQRLPELPARRKRRLAESYGLTQAEAHLLTLEAPLADFYERTAQLSGNPKSSANFVLNDLLREQNAAGRSETEIPLAPERLAELIRLVDAGTVSATAARRELFPEMYRSGRGARELVRRLDVEQISDAERLGSIVAAVLEAHPRQVEQYRAGKAGLLEFLLGKVMKASSGQANPRVVRRLLEEALR